MKPKVEQAATLAVEGGFHGPVKAENSKTFSKLSSEFAIVRFFRQKKTKEGNRVELKKEGNREERILFSSTEGVTIIYRPMRFTIA